MLGSIGSQVLNFGVLAILARELGPKAFGIVALASIWTRFLSFFLSQGLGMAIIQRKDLRPEHLDSAFWLSMATGGTLAGITFSFSPIIAGFFAEPQLTTVLKALSLIFVIGGLTSVQTAVLTRKHQFKKLASRSSAGSAGGSAVGVALAYFGAGVWALVAKQLVSSFVMAIVLWKTSSWRPSIRFSYSHLKDLWGFSKNVFARNIVSFIYIEIDKLLIGRLIGTSQLGFYSNSRQLTRTLIAIARQPVETVALPILSEMQSDRFKIAGFNLQSSKHDGSYAFDDFLRSRITRPRSSGNRIRP